MDETETLLLETDIKSGNDNHEDSNHSAVKSKVSMIHQVIDQRMECPFWYIFNAFLAIIKFMIIINSICFTFAISNSDTLQIIIVVVTIPFVIVSIIAAVITTYSWIIKYNNIWIAPVFIVLIPWFLMSLSALQGVFAYNKFASFAKKVNSKNKKLKEKSAVSEPYIIKLLKYCLDDSLDENDRFRRLLAVNYYLNAIFYNIDPNIKVDDDFVEIELDKLCKLQWNGYKDKEENITKAISWRDVMNRSCRKDDYKWLRFMPAAYRWSVIQFITYFSCFLYVVIGDNVDHRMIIFGSIIAFYIILEGINYRIRDSLSQINFYCCLILPQWKEKMLKYNVRWKKIFGSEDIMMKEIKGIYYIMFDQYEVIQSLNENMNDNDICGVISEFVWTKLPTYKNIDEYQKLIESSDDGQFDINICIMNDSD